MNKEKQPQRITSQEALDNLIRQQEDGRPLHCHISLNFGLRSSKDISLTANNDYCIYHEIDDSEEIINHDCFMSSSIGRAMSLGALYKY